MVLPFVNISGDPEQEYFVDGVTESLTTDLSRIAGAFVIARNTAFTLKGKSFDATRIGRELNVRYVLEGSVQRGEDRLRVNVQLIDAESGNHLWADRFDKPVADYLEMQDEIVARLAGQLGAELIAAEARRAENAPNPDAFDLHLQGSAWLNRGPLAATWRRRVTSSVALWRSSLTTSRLWSAAPWPTFGRSLILPAPKGRRASPRLKRRSRRRLPRRQPTRRPIWR